MKKAQKSSPSKFFDLKSKPQHTITKPFFTVNLKEAKFINLQSYPVRTKKEVRLIDKAPFGDKDRDTVPNYFDCKPLDKYKQGKMLKSGFPKKRKNKDIMLDTSIPVRVQPVKENNPYKGGKPQSFKPIKQGQSGSGYTSLAKREALRYHRMKNSTSTATPKQILESRTKRFREAHDEYGNLKSTDWVEKYLDTDAESPTKSQKRILEKGLTPREKYLLKPIRTRKENELDLYKISKIAKEKSAADIIEEDKKFKKIREIERKVRAAEINAKKEKMEASEKIRQEIMKKDKLLLQKQNTGSYIDKLSKLKDLKEAQYSLPENKELINKASEKLRERKIKIENKINKVLEEPAKELRERRMAEDKKYLKDKELASAFERADKREESKLKKETQEKMDKIDWESAPVEKIEKAEKYSPIIDDDVEIEISEGPENKKEKTAQDYLDEL
jgi:hypothetical protein